MRTLKIILSSFGLATVLVGFQNFDRPDSKLSLTLRPVKPSKEVLHTLKIKDLSRLACWSRE